MVGPYRRRVAVVAAGADVLHPAAIYRQVALRGGADGGVPGRRQRLLACGHDPRLLPRLWCSRCSCCSACRRATQVLGCGLCSELRPGEHGQQQVGRGSCKAVRRHVRSGGAEWAAPATQQRSSGRLRACTHACRQQPRARGYQRQPGEGSNVRGSRRVWHLAANLLEPAAVPLKSVLLVRVPWPRQSSAPAANVCDRRALWPEIDERSGCPL